MTSRSLWNYCRDEIDNVVDNASDAKSFRYKKKQYEKHQKDYYDLEMKEIQIDHHKQQYQL